MEDRQVRQLHPQPAPDAGKEEFSFYDARPNLVLLGNPGAGKTHLFQYFGERNGAVYVTARDFLNLPAADVRPVGALFIDALDEKRAGRGDSNTIDSIVAKLFEVRPKRVRISCRAADWLGETDLAVFCSYFDRSGECVVLELEPLSEEERIAVLKDKGIESPDLFLREAEQRGLEGLLTNPQNLIMLCEVVRKGDWPKTKRELFESSVDILLSEHNANHSDSTQGQFAPAELAHAAGGLCAVRLLSDIAGISLSASGSREDFPHFRELKVDQNDKAKSALCRRVFTASAHTSTVDYVHRTIAEYLAAQWLAVKIREGLPIGRVLALIGIDRRPASELRGVHAWLPVFLPEHAQELIDADPFGILSYGDVASLNPVMRKHLLVALKQLAENDPWFRAGESARQRIAPLSGSDMEGEFRAILTDATSPHSLRSIVLDALCAGAPIPALASELTSIAIDSGRPYAERRSSIEALARLDVHEPIRIETILDAIGNLKSDDIRLRAEILQGKYCIGSLSTRVAELLNAALEVDEHLPTGAFWRLEEVIPTQEIPHVLDSLKVPDEETGKRNDHINLTSVLYVVDRLLVRVIQENASINARKMLDWLLLRSRLARDYGAHTMVEVRDALANSPVLSRLVDVAIQSWGADYSHFWSDIFEFDRVTLSAVGKPALLEQAISEIVASNDERSRYFYELAFHLVWQMGSVAAFERVYALAGVREKLMSVRTVCCVCEIPDWRLENYSRKEAADLKSKKIKEKNLAQFDAQRDQIEAGCHLGWLAWIGQVYFAHFSDADREATPLQRLITALGEENTFVVVRGLSALLKTRKITPVSEVIRLNSDRKQHTWWYAILAALDLEVHTVDDINLFSPDYLQSALAIDCFHPTFRYEGNASHQNIPDWKGAFVESRPNLAADVYVAIARNDFAAGKEHLILPPFPGHLSKRLGIARILLG